MERSLVQDLNEQINQLEGIFSASFAMSLADVEKAVAAWVVSYSPIAEIVQKTTDDIHIALGQWQYVSSERMERLTLDERWEYQKWVLGAPLRWVRRRFARDGEAW